MVDIGAGERGVSSSDSLVSSLFTSLAGVVGTDSPSCSGILSPCRRGDEGRVTAGVESAVPRLAGFFCFFFRPMIGAWIGSSTGAFTRGSSAFVTSSSCFALACRSFFCWLLVACRTGAVPILLGGGESARDMEAEVIETLSDIRSSAGVPGR